MKKSKVIGVSTAVAAAVLCLTAGGPLYAHAQRDAAANSVSTEQHQSGEVENEVKHQTPEAGDDKGMHPELQRKGATITADLRKQNEARKAKTKTPEQRQKLCEARKSGMSNKFNHLVSNSQRLQTRIDGIYTKAQAFQQGSSTPVANYDSLVAAAKNAQAASAASIIALKAVTPTIDCTSTTVADGVATFRAATQQTRDNLKAYRAAVKAVLKALETAKTTTERSNQ